MADRGAGSHETEQIVRAENGGYAYGVIGADMYVFSHGGPVYLLHEHDVTRSMAGEGTTTQPSRMLDARSKVVSFTGREKELEDLTAWRNSEGDRVSALWLHGPGGQGKSRLATEFADRALKDGWKVVTATHGAGAIPPEPGSQDLRPHGAVGLLILVDYADRWPLTHLNWLFNNSLLRRPLPVRLLLVARSHTMWSSVRYGLEKAFQADTRAYALPPLENGTDDRRIMFSAARDSFARRYDLTDLAAVRPPSHLDRPEFGSVLSLHMAALVAVDAHVHGARPPEEMVGLSSYLLDREREHWTRLYENGKAGSDFTTSPATMHRVVFTAVLTGALPARNGAALLRRLEMPEPHRVLADHGTCYPATTPRSVLEPPYPDRFAEDLLAISLPGHTVDGHPSALWAEDVLDLIMGVSEDGPYPAHVPRALTFLVAAAAPERWPHVAEHVELLLRTDPELALFAGGDCLAGLAELDVALEVLEAVEAGLPDHRQIDLDAGIAELGRRLARERLCQTDDPAVRALEYRRLGERLARAGRYEEALVETEQAVDLHRALAERGDGAHDADLARSLSLLGRGHRALGHWREGFECAREAVRIYRGLPPGSAETHAVDLARALGELADLIVVDRHWPQALEAREEAVRLLIGQGDGVDADLGYALIGQAEILQALGRWEEAESVLNEAVAIYERLTEDEPGAHEPELGLALNSRASVLFRLRRPAESLPVFEEATEIFRRLADTNPEAFSGDLAGVLSNLSTVLHNTGRCQSAAVIAEETVERYRDLVAARPSQYQRGLADALVHHARCLAHEHRWQQAVLVKKEARDRFWDAGLEGAITPEAMLSEKAAEHVRKADALRLRRPTWAVDDHWVTLLDQEECWRDRHNRVHLVEEMEPSYCANVVRFVLSQAAGVIESLIMTNSDEPVDWRREDTPETWIVRRPLLKALARRARASERP
ncbi:tetratricopeptide repeat protein [Nocardiopsis alba]|uniref:tetratricopeptide repeat protein n=1 Tax=Nocardiopsis alba TaxID=53437 RepID=UPI0033E4F448